MIKDILNKLQIQINNINKIKKTITIKNPYNKLEMLLT
jgi:hypothetical protein